MNSSEVADLVESTLRAEFESMRHKDWAWVTEGEMKAIITLCRNGILGPGNAQYANVDGHKFETMPLTDLMNYIEEEGRDLVNYGVFVTWRVGQINLALKELMKQDFIQTIIMMNSIPPIAPIDSFVSPQSTEFTSDDPPSSTLESTSSKEESPPDPKP